MVTVDAPSIFLPGQYTRFAAFTVYDMANEVLGYEIMQLDYLITSPPAPIINSVKSAASLNESPLVPGDIVSIFGSNLSTGGVVSVVNYPKEHYPSYFTGGSVSFNGINSPILFAGASQINAVVPFGIASEGSVDIAVHRFGGDSPTVKRAMAPTSPAIFSADETGAGQGAIFYSGNVNGAIYRFLANAQYPAPAGSTITLYATDAGVLNGPIGDGDIIINQKLAPVAPVSLTIGGVPAVVTYAEAAHAFVAGVLKVRAVVPGNLAPGVQPVVITIGDQSSARQPITIYVK